MAGAHQVVPVDDDLQQEEDISTTAEQEPPPAKVTWTLLNASGRALLTTALSYFERRAGPLDDGLVETRSEMKAQR